MLTFNRLRDRRGGVSSFSFRVGTARILDGCIQDDTGLYGRVVNQQQEHVIDYLQEEIIVLKEQRGKKRMRFTDDQRSRLDCKAKRIGGERLKEIAGVVTPHTLHAWHRKLIA